MANPSSADKQTYFLVAKHACSVSKCHDCFFFSLHRTALPSVHSLTQKRQQYGIVVGHDKQVDAVESRAGLEVAKRLTEIAVLGTVANKHLKEKKKKKKSGNGRRCLRKRGFEIACFFLFF